MSSPNLAKNTLYLTGASVAQKAIAFLYFTLIARFIGAADTGAYFLALAIITVIAVVEDIGVTSVLVREVAKKSQDARTWLRSVMGVKMIMIPIAVLIALFGLELIGLFDADVVVLVRVAIFIMVADALSLTFYGVLRGFHTLKYESIGIFFGQVITAIVGVTLLSTGTATLEFLIAALIAGSAWNMCFSLYQVVRRLGWSALVPSFELGWEPVRVGLAFFIAAVFVKLLSYTDSVLINAFHGREEVGIYAVAYKLTYAFQFLPLTFVASLYPAMSAQMHDATKLKTTLMQSFWYMALIGFPIVFGIWSLAPEIIQLFYGADFAPAALSLEILIFALIVIFFDFPIGSLLNATGRQKAKTVITGLTLIVNIVSNLLLVPTHGAVGASIAGVISFTFLFLCGWIWVQKSVRIRIVDFLKNIWGLFVAALAMALTVLFLKEHIHFLFTVPIGVGIYLGLAFATKAIKVEHIRHFWRVLPLKKR